MRCYVLTGISRKTLEDLVKRNIRAIELRSAHNVATALKADIGSCVFLTPSKLYNVGRGTTGIIAEVSGKEVMSHSIIFASNHYIEESEMTVVRLRLTPRSVGRIVTVYNADILDSTEADVVEVSYFDAM
ncbi:DUF473 domain-containing protein [Archaeoglobus veneficus]|uniref:DUF473 domain-containing protein n=1 Tax=Archaeoglobus veneficus (strain DSM 11195 / SNP6) TaxID=693661 RepID=F2KMZ2_ARCVS|nr:DUF473 domain-containing protein [Archaeoglobus veneficus]AEA47268.1 protein of unknown function DUF473 [Archaeoglobus veneficus SNP6]